MAFQQNSWNMEKYIGRGTDTVIQYHLAWREGSRWLEIGNHPAITKNDILATTITGDGLLYCRFQLNILHRGPKPHEILDRPPSPGGTSRLPQWQILQRTDLYSSEYSWTVQGVPEVPCINLIDFKMAFDSVHRESIWKILRLYGIPHN